MKKILVFPMAVLALFFISCEGPAGPPGQDGINILGQVFEVTLDFNADNNFEPVIDIPLSIEVYESDVVLAYRWEGTFDGADIWTPLPATYFPTEGTLLYTFNHTFFDVKFFLDGNFDVSTLGSGWTNDQTFRIAIVPAEFANANLSMEQLEQSNQVEFIGN
ncbi:MAG: hypothetical protein R2793_08845 [Flavobacteriaceae bacterium]